MAPAAPWPAGALIQIGRPCTLEWSVRGAAAASVCRNRPVTGLLLVEVVRDVEWDVEWDVD